MWSQAGLLPPNLVCDKYVYIGNTFLHIVIVFPALFSLNIGRKVYHFQLAEKLVGPQIDQILNSGIGQ